MPVGMQIIADHFNEAVLLRVERPTRALQQLTSTGPPITGTAE